MTTSDKIRDFDPNAIGDAGNNIYGLPFEVENARVVILPVPWEVTVSYSAGTAEGPEAIYEASYQVDLCYPLLKDAWKTGVAMDEENAALKIKGQALREKAEKYIDLYSQGKLPERHADMLSILEEINAACAEMNAWVKSESLKYMEQGKFVAVLGGDHSTPLGLMQALAGKHTSFGILHIDAHADLRNAYEGFEFSHASIMFNAIKMPQISQLVQDAKRHGVVVRPVDVLHSDRDSTIDADGAVLGRLSIPMAGAYNASKHAVVALAESLRLEIGLRIAVILAEAGAIKTQFRATPKQASGDLPPRRDGQVVERVDPGWAASGEPVASDRWSAPMVSVRRAVPMC